MHNMSIHYFCSATFFSSAFVFHNPFDLNRPKCTQFLFFSSHHFLFALCKLFSFHHSRLAVDSMSEQLHTNNEILNIRRAPTKTKSFVKSVTTPFSEWQMGIILSMRAVLFSYDFDAALRRDVKWAWTGAICATAAPTLSVSTHRV